MAIHAAAERECCDAVKNCPGSYTVSRALQAVAQDAWQERSYHAAAAAAAACNLRNTCRCAPCVILADGGECTNQLSRFQCGSVFIVGL